MSEEKLYAVKNDEGKYWDFGNSGFWRRDFPDCLTTSSRKQAGLVAFENGGHVVTFVEEPKKIVLAKEQAQIVECAHGSEYPADYISSPLLWEAFFNGYTVETEKKYNLILGTNTYGDTDALFKSNPCTDAVLCIDADTYADDLKRDKFYQFTQEEIDKFNKDFWIKNIDLNDYKVEVNIDD